jgi:ParB-like chromosome segregation protein Spo0J
VCFVEVDTLDQSDSPRLDGVNMQHVRLLAQLDTDLPPILVHRPSMRVVDGMHRLRAARLAGRSTIAAQFFDGDEHEAFVLAVTTNIAHGLPLTLADREAAAARILAARPYTSNRSVAKIAGLAPKTLGAIRRRTAGAVEASVRIGGDGRVRRLDAAEGRRIASEVVASRPDASLREIAKLAGVSPATARDVRERMRRGDDPVPPRHDARWPAALVQPARSGYPVGVDRSDRRDVATLLQSLGKDPSLRFNDSGRALLRWLFARADGLEQWEDLVDAVPPHCAYLLADVAASCADEWSAFAAQLRQRLRAA